MQRAKRSLCVFALIVGVAGCKASGQEPDKHQDEHGMDSGIPNGGGGQGSHAGQGGQGGSNHQWAGQGGGPSAQPSARVNFKLQGVQ